MHRYVVSALLGAGLVVSAAVAHAGEELPLGIAQRLDKAPVAFSMSEAKRERLMIIQENMARQGYYGGSGYYSHPGYGDPVGPYGYGGAYGYYDFHPQRPPLNSLERGYYGR
ncbi:hypothetical protein [uncultured Bosea sp.]|uniref:hypothetical protein n=1 Tax=uncultured Bosea sp. TaxID=211457 RepID=UPI0025FAD5A7|nr:hypothetical protein [uncultured Bosea sp.]